MTLQTGKHPNKPSAFTLIELILVMTMMLIVVSVVMPSLKGFFRGRNLENEADQFLSLTRYGQSRAISEGIPVELWIDPARAVYGLQALSAYTETKTNPAVYPIDKTVTISMSPPKSIGSLTRSNYWTQTQSQVGPLTKIRFQPDGFISETSPEQIYFRQPDDGAQITIAENSTHLRYEIQKDPGSAKR